MLLSIRRAALGEDPEVRPPVVPVSRVVIGLDSA